MRLALRPPPILGESVDAYLLRASTINSEAWVPGSARVSDLVDVDSQAALQTFSAIPVSSKLIRIGSEQLSRKSWTTRARRWCPACWQEDMRAPTTGRHQFWNIHRRSWWDALAVVNCPIHHVRLETVCPTCNVEVAGQSESLFSCRNGHALFCEPEQVVPEHTLADAYIVGRLGGTAPLAIPLLDRFDLRTAIETIERFGVASLGGAHAVRSHFASERHSEIMSIGCKIAKDWPDAFIELLDRLASAPNLGLGKWGAGTIYGLLYTWSRRLPKGNPSAEAIKDLLYGHHNQGGFVHKRSIVRDNAVTEYLSLADISRACGKSSTTVVHYLKAMGQWPKDTRRGTPIHFHRTFLDKIRDVFNDQLGKTEARRLLGVSQIHFADLVNASILLPDDLHMKATGRIMFSRAHIQSKLAMLRRQPALNRTRLASLVPATEVSRRTRIGSFTGACKMLIDGKLKMTFAMASKPGCNGILVSPLEFRNECLAQLGYVLSVSETASVLKIHKETVREAIRIGLFDATDHHGQYFISRKEADEFWNRFISAAMLASQYQTKARYVIELMEHLGIKPKLQPGKKRRARVTIYLRADVPTDLGKLLYQQFPLRLLAHGSERESSGTRLRHNIP